MPHTAPPPVGLTEAGQVATLPTPPFIVSVQLLASVGIPPGNENDPGFPGGRVPLPRLPEHVKLLVVLGPKVGELQFAVVEVPGAPLDGLKLAVHVSLTAATLTLQAGLVAPNESVTVTLYDPSAEYIVLKLDPLPPVDGVPPGALQEVYVPEPKSAVNVEVFPTLTD